MAPPDGSRSTGPISYAELVPSDDTIALHVPLGSALTLPGVGPKLASLPHAPKEQLGTIVAR